MKNLTRVVILSVLLVGLGLAAIAVAQNEKGGGFGGDASSASYAPYEKVWIISVGISQYQNGAYNLQYADADAKAMAQTFASIYSVPQNQMRVVLNAEATATGIKSAFSSIQQYVGPQDGVIVYFSGHGMDYPLPSGGKMGYLVPFEGNMDDPFATCLDMDVLRKMADLLRAKHVIFLVDSCYSGIAGTQKSAASTAAAAEVSAMSQLPARQLITAGRGTERALELPHLQHSAFTYWLLNGLRGQADGNKDGYLLASELFMYLNPKVKTETNNAQTPQMFALPGGQEGEFIFKLDVQREAREAAAQVGALEGELATLKQRAAAAAQAKDAAKQREIEREQLRAEAALKEAKLREGAAAREKELQARAQADAQTRAAQAEQDIAAAKSRTEQLQRDAQAMREKLGTGSASAGRTVAEGIVEFRKISQAFVDLDKRYAEEYAAQSKPVDDYYNQRIAEMQPAPKDAFETEAQYQERKTNAERAIADLQGEQSAKKREIQNSVKSIIESQKTTLQGQLPAIEQITESVPREAISFQLSQYSAEAQAFGFNFQIKQGAAEGPYTAQVGIPSDKARVYAADSSLLVPEATVGIRSGRPVLTSLVFFGPQSGETYNVTNIEALLFKTACGSVIDLNTGLEWYAGPDGDMTWDEASSWVSGLSDCGGKWRMPDKNELATLREDGAGSFNRKTFVSTADINPVFQTTGWWVWTAKTKGNLFDWGFCFETEGGCIFCCPTYVARPRGFAVRTADFSVGARVLRLTKSEMSENEDLDSACKEEFGLSARAATPEELRLALNRGGSIDGLYPGLRQLEPEHPELADAEYGVVVTSDVIEAQKPSWIMDSVGNPIPEGTVLNYMIDGNGRLMKFEWHDRQWRPSTIPFGGKTPREVVNALASRIKASVSEIRVYTRRVACVIGD